MARRPRPTPADEYDVLRGDRPAQLALGILGGALLMSVVALVALYVGLLAGHFREGVDVRFVSGYVHRGDIDQAQRAR
jgi:hypothetical protein